jgi:hypothetical protein
MRLGFVLAALLGVVFAASSFAAVGETGRDRPPAKLTARLTDTEKALWMGEWVACRHNRLSKLAKLVGVKVAAGRTPQMTARLIAIRAEGPLWNLEAERTIAIDGCRNGILWRFYHE